MEKQNEDFLTSRQKKICERNRQIVAEAKELLADESVPAKTVKRFLANKYEMSYTNMFLILRAGGL